MADGPAPVDLWINSCVPKWNTSSYDYDVTVSWTVNGTLSVIDKFEVKWSEKDLSGKTQESSINHPTQNIIVS